MGRSGSLAISGQIVLEVVVRTFLHCFLGLPCVLVVCSTTTRGTRGNLVGSGWLEGARVLKS